ncbi:MAG TPA: GDSL-type esterase/lipase family protein, partial [Caulifigura sp.]|nr:GDSL-type esterase/lipase family protein [Caulifigura sp.]
GRGGDTAAGGLARLKEDVFDRGTTVLTVAYGINDIGWGTKADDEHRNLYLNSLREICRQCKEKNVRVYICSAAATASDPDKSENDYLKQMCDEGMQIGRDHGAGAIDVQGEMRKIQRKIKEANDREKPEKDKEHTLHAKDGIHLNDLGQIAFAYAVIKGLGGPAEVSSASVDAKSLDVVASGCRVSDVSTTSKGGVEFTRLDQGLPLNGETFFALNFRFVPIPEELNRYMLAVPSLEPGRYTVTVDGRTVGTFPANQLAKGVNIASSTADPWQPGGPWMAQGNILQQLTEARDKLDMTRLLTGAHLKERDLPKELAAPVATTNGQIEDMQRAIAKPRPYRFSIRKAAESDAKKTGG